MLVLELRLQPNSLTVRKARPPKVSKLRLTTKVRKGHGAADRGTGSATSDQVNYDLELILNRQLVLKKGLRDCSVDMQTLCLRIQLSRTA